MMRARDPDHRISCLCVAFVDAGEDHQYIYQQVVGLLEDRQIEAEVLYNDVPTNDSLRFREKGSAEVNALYQYTLRQLEEVRHEAAANE